MEVQLLCADEAKRAAKALDVDERASLREAGKRKLEEYRQLKQLLISGSLNEALQGRSIQLFQSRSLATGGSNPSLSANAPEAASCGQPLQQTQQPGQQQQQRQQQQQQQQTQHGAPRRGVAPQQAALAQAEAGAGADPLVEVLLRQVQGLMAERQALQNAMGQLRRENEQLSELVGYLSAQHSSEEASEEGGDMLLVAGGQQSPV